MCYVLMEKFDQPLHAVRPCTRAKPSYQATATALAVVQRARTATDKRQALDGGLVAMAREWTRAYK